MNNEKWIPFDGIAVPIDGDDSSYRLIANDRPNVYMQTLKKYCRIEGDKVYTMIGGHIDCKFSKK